MGNQTADKTYNIWTEVDSTTEGTISSKAYQMLTYTCGFSDATGAAGATPDFCTVSTAASNTVHPAFAFSKTKLHSSFKYNPLYPSTSDMDFILCFRYQ